MRYLSLFSGIEAATTAWQPLGWECVAVSEIEKFPSAVLKHHYPNIPNLGDVTKITEDDIKSLGPIDLVVFGSPCQDLSIAGKGLGFNGERSGLFTTAISIIQWARRHCGCRFALWENVLGAFSSNEGKDFATVVEQMAGCQNIETPKNGWGTEGAALGSDGLLEWCSLDAQWFGVAQRRRRVFALTDFGDWQSRSPILLEPESLRGDSPSSRESRKKIARNARNSTENESNAGRVDGFQGLPFESYTNEVTIPVKEIGYKGDTDLICVHGSQTPITLNDCGITVGRNNGTENVICYGVLDNLSSLTPESRDVKGGLGNSEIDSLKIKTTNTSPSVNYLYIVRRLTPTEDERLQGFPDGYTAVPWGNKSADECPDGHRYKALGNSMAVPVMRWIGKQINSVIGQN